eukprot:8860103-Pyramimonas_sp.AAC.1
MGIIRSRWAACSRIAGWATPQAVSEAISQNPPRRRTGIGATEEQKGKGDYRMSMEGEGEMERATAG